MSDIDPVTLVYADLLRRYMAASRRDLDGDGRQRIYDLVEAFRAEYPAECDAWEALWEAPSGKGES